LSSSNDCCGWITEIDVNISSPPVPGSGSSMRTAKQMDIDDFIILFIIIKDLSNVLKWRGGVK
jgi:hypothetical protein